MDYLQMYKRATSTLPLLEGEERPWGTWRTINEGAGYKIKLLEVSPGHRLSLQYHLLRSEQWVVVNGRARVVIGARTLELDPLQSVVIPVHTAHRLENPASETLLVLEVQQGEQLLEQDIVRLDDDYHRENTQSARREYK